LESSKVSDVNFIVQRTIVEVIFNSIAIKVFLAIIADSIAVCVDLIWIENVAAVVVGVWDSVVVNVLENIELN
jgi:hypothetical protein